MSEFYNPFPQIPYDRDYEEQNDSQKITPANTVLFTTIEKIMRVHEDVLPNENANQAYWNNVVQKEGWESEPHLATQEGRFQAFLNVANNGSKILEVLSMSEGFESHHQINERMRDWTRHNVCLPDNTLLHFKLSLAPTGAVAKGSRNESEWARTSFGTAILPGLIYMAEVFETLDINPQKALTSKSLPRKDSNGNLLTTPPYERALVLLLLSLGTHEMIDIAPLLHVIANSTKAHLVSLETAGLLTLESRDPVADTTKYTITDIGIEQNEWGIYSNTSKAGEVFRRKKASELVRKAINGLRSEGKDSIYLKDIGEYISRVFNESLGSGDISGISKFYAENGFLTRSLLNGDKYSDIRLTKKGEMFIATLLKILRFVGDPTAVEEINEIRDRLHISLDGSCPRNMMQALEAYSENLASQIAQRFETSSPHKTRTGQEGLSKILAFIRDNNGLYSSAEAARKCGVDKETALRVLKPYLESGRVVSVMHLDKNGKREGGNKQYLSIPDD